MKTLLTLLLILTSQILTSQMSYEFSTYIKTEPSEYRPVNLNIVKAKKQKLVPWKVTGIAVFATVTEAIGDAKFDDGCKIQGKALQAISLGSHFLYIPVMKNSNANWLLVPLVEACWRFILFDMVYNLTRGLPVGYIGNTSYFDKGMQSFAPPAGMRMFANGIIATFVITLTFDKF